MDYVGINQASCYLSGMHFYVSITTKAQSDGSSQVPFGVNVISLRLHLLDKRNPAIRSVDRISTVFHWYIRNVDLRLARSR